MTTAAEILTDALIDINALAPGQPLPANNGAVALRKLNDLLDSLSTDKDFIYTTTENIFTGWIPGTYKYSVGNPVGGTFSGTLIAGSAIISNVTVPTALAVNGDLTDNQGSISGATVLSFDPIGGTVTMSANALFTVPTPEIFTFTTPGQIKIARPLRINNSYTRITGSGTNLGLDYWFDFISMDRYNELGYKGVPGPWPIAAAYQPTFPLGTLWVYPNPSQAGEVHLFTDLILSEFTNIAQNVNLPQGYTRALKKIMAMELCPSWGKTPSPLLIAQAKEARGFLHALNAEPVVTLRYDSDIVRSQQNDAGWIMSGGFR